MELLLVASAFLALEFVYRLGRHAAEHDSQQRFIARRAAGH